jgi:chromosome segregation ATPase
VVPLRKGALQTDSHDKIAKFWRQYEQTAKRGSAIQFEVAEILKKVNRMHKAINQSTGDVGPIDKRLSLLRESILEMDKDLNGNRSKMQPGEKTNPTATSRLAVVHRTIEYSTYGPTKTAIENLSLAAIGLDKIQSQLKQNNNDIESLLRRMENAGSPWIEGAPIPKK